MSAKMIAANTPCLVFWLFPETKVIFSNFFGVNLILGSKIKECAPPKVGAGVVRNEIMVKSKGWAVKQSVAMERFQKYEQVGKNKAKKGMK
jgi:hypothetical protein